MFQLFDQNFEQIQALKAFFEQHPRIVVAFSGGCDSAFLLYAAWQAKIEVNAYIIRSKFQPEYEYDEAEKFCKKLGIALHPIDLDIMACTEAVKNTAERCYFCKRAMFEKICHQADLDGIPTVCEGTNSSDDIDDRPGWRAIQELNVQSPLRIAGFTKHLVRHLSLLTGLPTSTKPANACLATRIPCGSFITAEDLARIEEAENRLRSMGFNDFRVRMFHGAARLQFHEKDWSLAMNLNVQIRAKLLELFDTILIDTWMRT